MWSLIPVFFDIVLHRRGPDDLPASQTLLRLALIAYGAVLLATLSVVPMTEAQLLVVVVRPVVDIAALYLLLKVTDKTERFVQAATATFGCAVIVNVLALPVLHWNEALAAPPGEMTGPALLLLLMFFWSLDIFGFIVSKAMSQPYIVGLAVVVGYELSSMAVLEAILPAAG